MSVRRHVTRAALLEAPGRLGVAEVAFEGPDPGQILVRMKAAGVCHTDKHLHDSPDGWGRPFPMLLGHEGAGVVEAVGAGVEGIADGDHVAIGCRVPCGGCPQCRRGHARLCQSSAARAPVIEPAAGGGAVLSPMGIGLFAELVPVDARAAVVMDKDIPMGVLGLLGCAVMTGVGAVLNTAQVWPGARVAVMGCGGIGLAAVQGAAAANARQVIAIDLAARKLEWAGQLGATHTVDASERDAVEAVRELTGGEGVDFSFEAVGLPGCVEQCIEMLAYCGKATIVGKPQGESKFTVNLGGSTRGFFENTLTLTVTHGGDGLPAFDLPLYAQMHRRGRLDLDALATHEVDLSGIGEGFERMESGGAIRTVVRF